MNLASYSLVSCTATLAAILFAFHTRSQFYPAVVFLVSSKLNVLVLGNFCFCFALCLGRLLQQLYLGKLSSLEIQAVKDNARFALMDTCLALTIFRSELGLHTFALFSVLFFFKVFHWILKPRIDSIGWSQGLGVLVHIRTQAFLLFLYLVDVLSATAFAYLLLRRSSPNVYLLFAFEYSVLLVYVCRVSAQYLLAVVDARIPGDWPNKPVYLFYVDLVADLLRLFLYLSFFVVVCIYFGLPIHLFRELYTTFATLRKRVLGYLRYRKLVQRLEGKLEWASEQELEETGDRSCIVCREVMERGKKLPCGHVFHLHCLRTWMERSNTCPVCRAVISTSTSETTVPNDAPRNAPDPVIPQRQQQEQQPQQQPQPTLFHSKDKVGTISRERQLQLLQASALLVERQIQIQTSVIQHLHEQYREILGIQRGLLESVHDEHSLAEEEGKEETHNPPDTGHVQ